MHEEDELKPRVSSSLLLPFLAALLMLVPTALRLCHPQGCSHHPSCGSLGTILPSPPVRWPPGSLLPSYLPPFCATGLSLACPPSWDSNPGPSAEPPCLLGQAWSHRLGKGTWAKPAYPPISFYSRHYVELPVCVFRWDWLSGGGQAPRPGKRSSCCVAAEVQPGA